MVGRLLGIRQRDHRDTAVGFSTLLLTMAAHAVLETARDALFLARLPASLLPWSYLAMAALTLLAAAFQRRVLARLPRGRVLGLTLLLGAIVTASFSLASSLAGSALTLMAFYVWTGLLATVVVVQFWLLVGDVMDLGQAKRAFAVIGGGGLLGATLGSALASAVLFFLTPRSLPLVASALLASSAILPVLFSHQRVSRGSRVSSVAPQQSRVALLSKDPYLRRVLLLVLLGTLTVTGVDYVFKATVARQVAPDRLGEFFARYYTVLNGLALAVQMAIAPRLLQSAGIHRTLLLMPALLLGASFGFALFGGLGTVLLLKGADGTLRHSVQRVVTEILYLPLSNELRERFKAFIEAVGQRGGQALASVLILLALALGWDVTLVVWGVVAVALAWLACTFGLEALYVQLFREQLKSGTIETHVQVPELDLRSLEALLSALSSEDDGEVVAALDMFAAYDKANLVPALILHHPARQVVLRALELLGSSPRADVLRVVARLVRHRDHEVRAAALRLLAAERPDSALLEGLCRDQSPAVRVTALLGLIHSGAIDAERAEAELEHVVRGSSPDARLALAQGAHLLSAERHGPLLRELAACDERGLRAALAGALVTAPEHAHVPVLIRLLADRDARRDARLALVALGDRALDALERAFEDASLSRAERRHVPRTISCFSGRRAVAILERFLEQESDEAIGLKLLRGLGRMRANDPEMPVDGALLERLARRTVERAVTLAYHRELVEVARRALPRVRTPASELLAAALADLRERALERAFRLLHVLQPRDELELVYDALKSGDREMRARGRELFEHVAPASVRDGILALLDDAPPSERLRAALAFYEPRGARAFLELVRELEIEPEADLDGRMANLAYGYAALLSALREDSSRVLSAIAGHHLLELGRVAERSGRMELHADF